MPVTVIALLKNPSAEENTRVDVLEKLAVPVGVWRVKLQVGRYAQNFGMYDVIVPNNLFSFVKRARLPNSFV